MSASSAGSTALLTPRGGAIVLMVIALLEALIGFLFPAANFLFLVVTGTLPKVPEGESGSDLLRGHMPFPVPWWAYLLIPLALGVLLAVTHDPSRQYPARMNGKVLLTNTPFFLAFWAFVWAGLCVGPTTDYTASGFGLYWIPALLSLVVAGAAAALGFRQRSIPAKKRRGPRAA